MPIPILFIHIYVYTPTHTLAHSLFHSFSITNLYTHAHTFAGEKYGSLYDGCFAGSSIVPCLPLLNIRTDRFSSLPLSVFQFFPLPPPPFFRFNTFLFQQLGGSQSQYCMRHFENTMVAGFCDLVERFFGGGNKRQVRMLIDGSV